MSRYLPIQAILIALLVLVYAVHRAAVRGRPARGRNWSLAALALAILAVLFPDATTVVATRLGVSRGVDLVIYLMLVFFLFALVTLQSRQAQLRRDVTLLARSIALANARPAPDAAPPPPSADAKVR